MPENTPSIHPANATFKTLFLETGTPTPLYYIPNYQRYYAWEEHQVKQFLEDLTYCVSIEHDERISYQHFLGQIIMRDAQEKNEDEEFKHYEIIDGQQRITTFLMLCLVIHHNLRSILQDNPAFQRELEERITEINTIIYKSGRQCRLTLSRNDHAFWETVLEKYTRFFETELVPQNITSQKRLFAAVSFIDSYLTSKILSLDDNLKKAILLDYYNALLTRMHIITVTSEPREYMFSLFQTVNDRGRLLTNGELLKAKTLESLRLNETKQSVAEQCWNDILSDEGKTTDQYLEWCLISYSGEPINTTRSLYHQYVDLYFTESQRRQLNEPQMDSLLSKIRDLRYDVQACRILVEGTWPYPDDTRANWQKGRLKGLIKRMRHNKCIPIFVSAMYTYRKLPGSATSQQKKAKYELFYNILDIVDRFFFVYIKVCDADENNFRNAYAKFSNNLRVEDSCNVQNLVSRLRSVMESARCSDLLNAYLDGLIYAQKKTHTQEIHLLYLLEIYYTTNLENALIPTIDDAIDIDLGGLSVEHIYPKGLDQGRQNPAMENKKHKIGNLTLLGKRQNQELEDKDYSEKRDAYSSSSFRITRDIAQNPEWTDITFNARQTHLCRLAHKILIF